MDYPLLCIVLFLLLQKFCDILQYSYHDWKHKTIHLCATPHENTHRQNPTRELYNLNPLSSQSISLYNPVHEMHVGKLLTNVIMHVAWNLCRKWRFKSTKSIHPLHFSAPSAASPLLFCTTFPYEICILRFPLPPFTFLTYIFETFYIAKHITTVQFTIPIR